METVSTSQTEKTATAERWGWPSLHGGRLVGDLVIERPTDDGKIKGEFATGLEVLLAIEGVFWTDQERLANPGVFHRENILQGPETLAALGLFRSIREESAHEPLSPRALGRHLGQTMFDRPMGDGMVKSTRMALAGVLFLAMSSCGFLDMIAFESRPTRVERLLSSLAADSMAGRSIGSLGSAMAARLIAAEFDDAGVAPAGTSGYVQEIAAVRLTLPDGGSRVVTAEAADTFPDSAKEFVSDRNLIGIVHGSDPTVADELIVVGAHFDHVGVGRPVDGDSIYNGADDDASGVVAVLEAARDLASGPPPPPPPPRRTVVFALFTGEEVGGLGSRWYVDHPAVPLDQTVAQLQVEMIGRPDSLAGGPGMLWATGYDRSTVGAIFSSLGVPVVADPYPDRNFFFRSDNVRFAYEGIPAHTLSSYNLHSDYHRPSDEVGGVDFDHLVAAIETVIMAVRTLADAPSAPAWIEGGRPERIAR